jgi:hypothetical protein
LLAEIGLDHVGLVLGLEMSRLARSTKTGINSWNCVPFSAPCWLIRMACMIRPTTTIVCYLASKEP